MALLIGGDVRSLKCPVVGPPILVVRYEFLWCVIVFM